VHEPHPARRHDDGFSQHLGGLEARLTAYTSLQKLQRQRIEINADTTSALTPKDLSVQKNQGAREITD